MEYKLTSHTLQRMRERLISIRLIEEALAHPDKVLHDEKRRMLIKKLYERNGRQRLLLIVGEQEENVFVIITVIDTSKIKKYL